MNLIIFLFVTIFVIACSADPLPHSDHSKLFILSKLAFNYLDADGDGRLSADEMTAVRELPVNGMLAKSVVDVKRMSDSMDLNKNNFVEEAEFIKFDSWLPLFINGRPKTNVRLRDLQRYGQGGNSVAYSLLDSNQDGVIDHKELSFE